MIDTCDCLLAVSEKQIQGAREADPKGGVTKSMDASRIESLSFEDSYARLEQVIQRLEEGDLGLEESIALYEEGVKLAEQCGRMLDDAELRVTQLVSGLEDQVDEVPFEEG